MRTSLIVATLWLAGCRAATSVEPPPPAPAAAPSEPQPAAELDPHCTRNHDCADGLACIAGTCTSCTGDPQCVMGHCELPRGRCVHGPPPPHPPGAEFTAVYWDWLRERLATAQRGNLEPSIYEPCNAGRHCGLRWSMDWQLFAEGSSEVEADPQVVLMLAHGFDNDPSARLTLVGHAAATEPDPDGLSLARAENVLAWLVGEGLEAARIEVSAAGASRPVYSDSERVPGADRRVEFLLSSDASPVGWWPRPRRKPR